MEIIEQICGDLASLISSEELKRLGEKYHIVYKRKRRLAICIFFWLLVLSASIPAARGIYSRCQGWPHAIGHLLHRCFLPALRDPESFISHSNGN